RPLTEIGSRKPAAVEVALVVALFAAGAATSLAALRAFRAANIQPRFYQGNFEPAVMMACGHGFTTIRYDTIPISMKQFLALSRDTFDCSDLSPTPALAPVTWNGPWYHLYGTTALVWKIRGVSWLALDGLVAVLGGVTTAALYGLFRLAAGRLTS